MMIPTATFCLNPVVKKVLEAGLYTSAVKSVGSGFRYYDARNADPELKRNIARGEALTVAQVSIYSIIIDQLVSLAQKIASQSAKESLLKTSLQKLTKNRPLTLMVLGCTANFCAEKISRSVFNRDLGPDGNSLADEEKAEPKLEHDDKEKDGPHENRPDSHEGHKRAESKPDPAAVALRFAQSEPLRHQPLTFARSNNAPITYRPPNANPFQFAVQPAFAKPAFSI